MRAGNPKLFDHKADGIRRLYRVYLARFAVFRRLKSVGLRFWWSFRNFVYAVGLLSTPRMFYRTYLAQFWAFRAFKRPVLWIYFRYPLAIGRVRFLLRRPRRFHLLSMREFAAESGLALISVEPAETIEIPGPKFVGDYPITIHATETVRFKMPATEVVELPDVTLVGGTNLILHDESAIYPDLLVPARDVIPAELFGVAKVDLTEGHIDILLQRRAVEVEQAISLLGQCAGNYAHWLTETLPKLVIIDEIEEFDGLPLVVDQWIHPNFHASIDMFNRKKRRVIGIDRWESISLESVVDISPTAYVPAEFRTYVADQAIPTPDPNFFPFSQFALNKLRRAAKAVRLSAKNVSLKRLYLRRPPESTGNPRFISNMKEVEQIISSYGFHAIDPGKLSFSEQVAVFRDVECVVGSVGAALANIIFSTPGCQIIALAPYYENANYYYFSNLMGVLGHRLYYVLGPQEENASVHPFHRNYSIDLDALHDGLEKLTR